jgi:hypothetical protein
MDAPTPLIDLPYEQYAACARALHCLFLAGEGESDEADELRDRMDEHWEALTEEQRALVSGLTADLNWIRREPVRAEAARDAVLTEDLPKLAAAIKSGEWRSVLETLRRAAPYLTRPTVAEMRGRAWEGLGDDDSARLFFEHALSFEHAAGPRPMPVWALNSQIHITRSPRLAGATQ